MEVDENGDERSQDDDAAASPDAEADGKRTRGRKVAASSARSTRRSSRRASKPTEEEADEWWGEVRMRQFMFF